ncbi:MAG: methyltransferase domain-containing protein [Myxococcales bacterium]|nr:methyltransferase domain-containing protein [Myxococcales bacterium]
MSTRYYDDHAADLVARYEHLSPEELHKVWSGLLPQGDAVVLDIGAGSGRDAAWLCSHGHEVLAVEPSKGMREMAQKLHPSAQIRWLDDRLPSLSATYALELRFDVILCGAVWMHVAPSERARAFRKVVQLLKPGGIVIFTLRQGPLPPQPMESVAPEELVQLSHQFALEMVLQHQSGDRLQREGVSWDTLVFRLADDGTGTLPLLRHIILHDAKTTTYKVALLRTLLRIADGATGAVLARTDETVTLPMGLVALYWLRMYKPLLQRERPIPQIGGTRQLRFVGEAFDTLYDVSPFDLRVGAVFSGKHAKALLETLLLACQSIQRGPVTYTTLPESLLRGGGKAVFSCKAKRFKMRTDGLLQLDWNTLTALGEFTLPRALWDALALHACWVEPALLQTWIQLMQGFEKQTSLTRDLGEYYEALRWLDPLRDTQEVRKKVESLQKQGLTPHCVWSGKPIVGAFAVDHCFPFAHWPNNDLWNLLPTLPQVNQKKSDRLPSASLLSQAQERILAWWDGAYLQPSEQTRFFQEARTALPWGEQGKSLDTAGVFDALQIQRMRLRQTQQLLEWNG